MNRAIQSITATLRSWSTRWLWVVQGAIGIAVLAYFTGCSDDLARYF